MLIKLIKYEFKATYKFFGAVFLVVLIVSLITTVTGINSINAEPENTKAAITGMQCLLKLFSACAAAEVILLIYALLRFCKNHFGDRGYFNNTIPTDAGTIIAAENITAVFWATLIFCTLIFCSFLILNITSLYDRNFGLIAATSYFYPQLNRSFVTDFILKAIVNFSKQLMIIYAAIAIGYSFNKHRRLKSFVSYILIQLMLSGANELYTAFKRYFILKADDPSVKVIDMSSYSGMGLCLSLLLGLALTVVIFLIARYFIKNRLNLL